MKLWLCTWFRPGIKTIQQLQHLNGRGTAWAVVLSGLLHSISFVRSFQSIEFWCIFVVYISLMNEVPSLNYVCNNLNARCSATVVTELLHSNSFVPFSRLHSDWIFCSLHIYHEWRTFVLFSHSNAQQHSNAGRNHGDPSVYASKPAKVLHSSRYTETECSKQAHLEPHSLLN